MGNVASVNLFEIRKLLSSGIATIKGSAARLSQKGAGRQKWKQETHKTRYMKTNVNVPEIYSFKSAEVENKRYAAPEAHERFRSLAPLTISVKSSTNPLSVSDFADNATAQDAPDSELAAEC